MKVIPVRRFVLCSVCVCTCEGVGVDTTFYYLRPVGCTPFSSSLRLVQGEVLGVRISGRSCPFLNNVHKGTERIPGRGSYERSRSGDDS